MSNATDSLFQSKWLKSLHCTMDIEVYQVKLNLFPFGREPTISILITNFSLQSYFTLLHRWWTRIIRYLETSSVGSDLVEAMNLIKVHISLKASYILSHNLVLSMSYEVLLIIFRFLSLGDR